MIKNKKATSFTSTRSHSGQAVAQAQKIFYNKNTVQAIPACAKSCTLEILTAFRLIKRPRFSFLKNAFSSLRKASNQTPTPHGERPNSTPIQSRHHFAPNSDEVMLDCFCFHIPMNIQSTSKFAIYK